MTVLLDIYLLTSGLGFVYIVGSSLLGGFGSHVAHGGGHAGAGHALGHSSSVHSVGHAGGAHGISHSGVGRVTGNTGSNVGSHTAMGHSGTHTGTSHTSAQSNMGQSSGHPSAQTNSGGTQHIARGQNPALNEVAPMLAQSVSNSRKTNNVPEFYLKLIDLLNPTKIALFIFLFGAIGIVCSKFLPGYFSLAPAIIIGWLFANWFFQLMGTFLSRIGSSTNFSKDSLIGSLGELTISIPAGSTGEVTVSTGNSRYSYAAKASDPTQSLNKLSKVVVVDLKENMFIVEPFDE